MSPECGQVVQLRSRRYLVEEVLSPPKSGDDTLVRLACLDDDNQGQSLEVLWESEVDARIIGASGWESVTRRGFDEPHLFSAYLHSLRWNCVTATDPELFQAPYRAGIEVKAYQLEPLAKALRLPRVNLFIADDVGLGKTIEAGLIVREMLLRQKLKRIVISAPPSVVRQWQEELQIRFGLSFVIYDRDYVTARRRERGYSCNPWSTHSRFIISHALLRDENYAAPLRDWLGEFQSHSMLILDEAHHAAPSSGSRYAVDSKLTRAVRDLARRFEHRLFLSATPHNGHSNSFAALLEILDPQRFTRGIPVSSKKLLDQVMVRRLKSDLRAAGETGIPRRDVVPIIIDGLPEDCPELQLSRLLQSYRQARERRLASAPPGVQRCAALVMVSLQKRLLSSMTAFARTLRVHAEAVQRRYENPESDGLNVRPVQLTLLAQSPDSDDERSGLGEDEVKAEDDGEMSAATMQSGHPMERELELLSAMREIANSARELPDVRFEKLLDWIKTNLCPELGTPGATWLPRRVLIFTEYADTKDYLRRQLEAALETSDRGLERVQTFHGGIGEERREEIKAAFNSDPQRHPLRILIATDAAREGINLQNHCYDLFHFDVPWNPSRMEQRNGRIDRKLQRSEFVTCRYFVLPQRVEDKVLQVLVEKTARIQKELGSLAPVIERDLDALLSQGIRSEDADSLRERINSIERRDALTEEKQRAVSTELEEARIQNNELQQRLGRLQKLLYESQEWLRLDQGHLQKALQASLEIMNLGPLEPMSAENAVEDKARASWRFPDISSLPHVDPSWLLALDSLRRPRQPEEKIWEWRQSAPVRPIIFRDAGALDADSVHLHLEHVLVRRLLSRFLAQGFLHDELRRACVVRTEDPIPKVLLLGRLSLYGAGAARLHDEIIAAAAIWEQPGTRRAKLKDMKEQEKSKVLEDLEFSLGQAHLREVDPKLRALFQSGAQGDVRELLPALQKRSELLAESAIKKLRKRAEQEAREMTEILGGQRKRILEQQKRIERDLKQGVLSFVKAEEAQLKADQREWLRRIERIEDELKTEPERIRAGYEVMARRLEPVGLVYLWPVSS